MREIAGFIDALTVVCREHGFHVIGNRDSQYVEIRRNDDGYVPSGVDKAEWTGDGYEFLTY
jgi:hypothetical protein